MNVYHCLENTREYHQVEPQFVEVAPEHAPAVEALIHAYPEYMTIESLPLQDDAEKVIHYSIIFPKDIFQSRSSQSQSILISSHYMNTDYLTFTASLV